MTLDMHHFIHRALSLVLLASACSAHSESIEGEPIELTSSEQPLGMRRGELLRVTALRTFSAAEVASALEEATFDTSAVEHGVSLSRIVYRTPDVHGRPSEASALVALPDSGARRLALVSYTHGAMVFRGDAPSVSQDPITRAPALTFAAAGFAAVLPDYLGLGEGPGTHPFMHVPSEASASLDAVRATRRLLEREGKAIEPGIYVTGFSQGATAAFGLAHALERDRTLMLAALAPIGGAHEWSRWVRDATGGVIVPKFAAVVLGYMTVAWDRVGSLYREPSDFFQPPYDASLESLYDSRHTTAEVLAGTPDSPGQLFTAGAFNQLASSPRGALARALREVDRACAGVDAPTLLLAARGDSFVTISHSEHCLARLQRAGTDATLLDLGEIEHDPSNIAGTREALRFFSSLR